VVDAYSALIMTRSYQASLEHGDALELISAGSGSHFDPEVVTAFENLCHSGDIRRAPR
jgi:HD-GYP domain-containing protein (c-di-GMP phosphodiesterase class II)